MLRMIALLALIPLLSGCLLKYQGQNYSSSYRTNDTSNNKYDDLREKITNNLDQKDKPHREYLMTFNSDVYVGERLERANYPRKAFIDVEKDYSVYWVCGKNSRVFLGQSKGYGRKDVKNTIENFLFSKSEVVDLIRVNDYLGNYQDKSSYQWFTQTVEELKYR